MEKQMGTYGKPEMAKLTTPLEEDVAKRRAFYIFFLFFIGLFNNTGYVLTGAAASDVAKSFGEESFMAMFQLSLIMFSAVTRIINSRYLIKIPHMYRILGVFTGAVTSYVILIVSTSAKQKYGFYLALVGSALCGMMQALGESVVVGFLKVFPTDLVVGWSSGTGMAGMLGTSIVIILGEFDVELPIIFSVLIPFQVIYLLCFVWINKQKQRFFRFVAEPQTDPRDENNNLSLEDSADNNQNGMEPSKSLLESDSKTNLDLNCKNVKDIFPHISKLVICLGLVYFLEYCCTVGYNQVISYHLKQKHDKTKVLYKEAYPIIQFFYQVGVFISRSSLSYIKIKRIEILTILQAINWCAFLIFSYYTVMPIWGFMILMVWVGLMGGGTYVNVMYLILNRDDLLRKQKELGINISTVFNDSGVLLSSLYSLFVDNIMFHLK